MDFKLKDKTAIVTGGGSGLGYEISKKLLSHGANVIIVGRNKGALKYANKQLSEFCINNAFIDYFVCDISDEASVIKLISKITKKYKIFSILINNAGIQGSKGKFEENNWKEWKQTIEINLFGSALMIRESLKVFTKNNYGKIIQLSGGGATKPSPNLSAYASSKAGIVRFIETISVELKDKNIYANCVAPGAVNTNMVDEIISSGPKKVGKELYEKSLAQKQNGGSSPEHCANLVAFLASPKSDGISGKLISALWDNYLDLLNHKNELAETDVYTLRRIVARDRDYDWGDK